MKFDFVKVDAGFQEGNGSRDMSGINISHIHILPNRLGVIPTRFSQL